MPKRTDSQSILVSGADQFDALAADTAWVAATARSAPHYIAEIEGTDSQICDWKVL